MMWPFPWVSMQFLYRLAANSLKIHTFISQLISSSFNSHATCCVLRLFVLRKELFSPHCFPSYFRVSFLYVPPDLLFLYLYFRIFKVIGPSQGNGSANKSTCHLALMIWWPEFDSQDPDGGKRELASTSCPVSSASTQWYTCPHMHT